MFELVEMLAQQAQVIQFSLKYGEVEFVVGNTEIALNWLDQTVYVENVPLEYFAFYSFETKRLSKKVQRNLGEITELEVVSV